MRVLVFQTKSPKENSEWKCVIRTVTGQVGFPNLAVLQKVHYGLYCHFPIIPMPIWSEPHWQLHRDSQCNFIPLARPGRCRGLTCSTSVSSGSGPSARCELTRARRAANGQTAQQGKSWAVRLIQLKSPSRNLTAALWFKRETAWLTKWKCKTNQLNIMYNLRSEMRIGMGQASALTAKKHTGHLSGELVTRQRRTGFIISCALSLSLPLSFCQSKWSLSNVSWCSLYNMSLCYMSLIITF